MCLSQRSDTNDRWGSFIFFQVRKIKLGTHVYLQGRGFFTRDSLTCSPPCLKRQRFASLRARGKNTTQPVSCDKCKIPKSSTAFFGTALQHVLTREVFRPHQVKAVYSLTTAYCKSVTLYCGDSFSQVDFSWKHSCWLRFLVCHLLQCQSMPFTFDYALLSFSTAAITFTAGQLHNNYRSCCWISIQFWFVVLC